MKCPACNHRLTELHVGPVKVDACQNGCGGIWFDAFELPRVDEPHEEAGDRLLHIKRNPQVSVDHARKRDCPRCPDIRLKRHFFSARRRVEVDQCPNCGGYWLDAGELACIRDEKTEAARAQKEARESTLSPEMIRYLYRLHTANRRD
jgi:uncharacterized protein